MTNEQWAQWVRQHLERTGGDEAIQYRDKVMAMIRYKPTQVVDFWIENMRNKGKTAEQTAEVINKAVNMRLEALLKV